jgi:hypothetical protein
MSVRTSFVQLRFTQIWGCASSYICKLFVNQVLGTFSSRKSITNIVQLSHANYILRIRSSSAFCLSKWVLQRARTSAASFNFQYLRVSLRSCNSWLRLVPRLPIPSIFIHILWDILIKLCIITYVVKVYFTGGTIMEAERPKLETHSFKPGHPVWISSEQIFVVTASSVRFFFVVRYPT